MDLTLNNAVREITCTNIISFQEFNSLWRPVECVDSKTQVNNYE